MRKLSQLSTDECLDVLCEIAPHVANIVTDETIADSIGKASTKKGLTTAGVVMEAANRATRAIPSLLKTHRDDIYHILAAIGGVDVDEIAKQNTIVTLMQLRTIFRDKELTDFFKSWAHGDANEQ